MKPFVFSATSLAQLDNCLKERLSGDHPYSVAIVFFAIVFAPADIIKAFRNHKIEVFGASSAGEIANGKVAENSISVMLLDMDQDAFRVGIFKGMDKTSSQLGKEIAEWAKVVFRNPSLTILSTGLSGVDGDEVVKGITSGMGSKVPLFGALAGNDMEPGHQTYVISSSNFYNNGIVAMVIDNDKMETKGIAVCGWKGIGIAKTVTRSVGNQVYTINGQPAMEVYEKYLDIKSNADIGYNAFGILLERKDGTSVMRGAVAEREDKSVMYTGTIPEGSRIRFCMSPGFEVIDRTLEKLKEFNNSIPDSDAILAFDCVARRSSLGPMVEQETSALADRWGVPVAGFFSFGEFGNNEKGNCDFHSYTLSALFLKKK
jgi:hypothetical protein